MKLAPAITLLLPLILVTTACGSSMNAPDIKQNAHPKMRYEITMVMEDSPGSFDSVTGFMQYDVTNEHCAPFEKLAGVYHTPPGQNPSIAFTRIGDSKYMGIVYLDLLQDEDYYGLGICHWSMVAAIARLKFQEVTFSPHILQDQIVSQQSITLYFPKKAYGNASLRDSSDGGSTMSDIVARHRDEFFSVTLSAKEGFE